MSRAPCGQRVTCRAYQLTVAEFGRLGGEKWTHSFHVRLGIRALKLFGTVYTKKKPKKVRSTTKPAWRGLVCRYPCGVLEQAYLELKAEDAGVAHAAT
jgi:hypothetical protein